VENFTIAIAIKKDDTCMAIVAFFVGSSFYGSFYPIELSDLESVERNT
jgi:hypothetical protein